MKPLKPISNPLSNTTRDIDPSASISPALRQKRFAERLLSVLTFLFVCSSAQAVEKKISIHKVPQSLFLIKKAKVDANVGEPEFHPVDAQLRTISNEPTLHNLGKYK